MRLPLADELGRFDATRPLASARTIPNTWYTSSEVAATERVAVFGATWQMVGRAAQVTDPGSYLTADVAGEPVLVVRGDDGVLRAFFNVCRHRAAPLLTDACGTATKLRCRYHGWTYDLAGKLRGTPEFDGVQEFNKEDNGLVPMAVAVWGPFVWVHLDKPKEAVEEYLAPLPEWSHGKIDGLKFARRVEYELACNWKVYVDNYLDGGYHVNTVHPALAGVLDYTGYKTTVHAHSSVQTSPMKPGDPNDPATKTRTGTEAAYWWVFPNFMLNSYAGVMDTNLVQPLGPDRCKVIFDYYFAAATPAGFIDQSVGVAHQVQVEDVGICEEVQRGLNSRSYTVGRFSVKREAGGYHFQQLLARFLSAGP
ncbi:MAG TPA: SRPBCC family protein [Gemmataceae bacterium]|nr:SRPBCC family protein [Gemmataceae bacterium]